MQPNQQMNPGKTLGIASMIVSIVGFGLVGLILGIVATNQSKKAGQKNGFALAGIIVGIVNMIVVTTLTIIVIAAGVMTAQRCSQLGPGTYVDSGTTITCRSSSSAY